MYPTDAITEWREISGVTNVTIANGSNVKTILGIAMQQGNVASQTDLRCGNSVIARNYATNLSYIPLNYRCSDTININKTGNDNASVVVTYVPYDMRYMSTSTVERLADIGKLGPSYFDWLLIAGVAIFFISFMTWGAISFTKP